MIAKPDGPGVPGFNARRTEFVSLIKAMSEVKVVRRWNRRPTPPGAPPGSSVRAPEKPAQIVAIAASTGGPAVLQNIFRNLPGNFQLPILVVQHIARGFVGGLVDWLSEGSPLRIKLAEDSEHLRKRTVYIAPEDRHLGVKPGGLVSLSTAPEIGGFRPSATFMFRSIANVYGAEAAAVILTGMGRDGVDGLADVANSGGQVIAQDEQSCVVYGMPQEAVRAGVVSTTLKASEIAGYLAKIKRRGL